MSGDEAKPPRVFISYSHADAENRAWVMSLAHRLRTQDEIDVRIDAYVEGAPPEGWPAWMEREHEAADFVLYLIDEARGRSRNTPQGGRGVEYEDHLRLTELYDQKQRHRAIVIQRVGNRALVPKNLRLAEHYVPDAPGQYQALRRHLLAQPVTAAPPLGRVPETPAIEAAVGPGPPPRPPPPPPETVPLDDLDRALADRNPRRAAALALESDDATDHLTARLEEIDPRDLRVWTERVVEDHDPTDLARTLAAEATFLVVGARIADGELDILGEPLLHRLWAAVSETLGERWPGHAPYPLAFDPRSTTFQIRWWAACWSWSRHVGTPPDFRCAWPALFPWWSGASFEEVAAATLSIPRPGPTGAARGEDALALLQLAAAFADGFRRESGAELSWIFALPVLAEPALASDGSFDATLEDLAYLEVWPALARTLIDELTDAARAALAARCLASAARRSPFMPLATWRDRDPALFEALTPHLPAEAWLPHLQYAVVAFDEELAAIPRATLGLLARALFRHPHPYQPFLLAPLAAAGLDGPAIAELIGDYPSRSLQAAQATWRFAPAAALAIVARDWAAQPDQLRHVIGESPSDHAAAVLGVLERDPPQVHRDWLARWLLFRSSTRGPVGPRAHRLYVLHQQAPVSPVSAP